MKYFTDIFFYTATICDDFIFKYLFISNNFWHSRFENHGGSEQVPLNLAATIWDLIDNCNSVNLTVQNNVRVTGIFTND